MRVAVLGAGAIGSYVGTKLSSVGCSVVLIGRRPPKAKSARSIRGKVATPGDLERTTDPAAVEGAGVVIVAVKSMDTAAAAQALDGHLDPGAVVVSLQNGLRNVPVLARLGVEVVPGMVTFNVIWDGDDLLQSTSGPILAGKTEKLRPWIAKLRESGEEAGFRTDMDAVQMGKLLVNLGNGICAVANVSVAEFVRSRTLRRAYARCMREGLEVAKQAKRPVASLGLLSPWLVSRMLPVRDAIFFRVAKRLISIDPRARSSTLQDLDAKKPTEIDHLNGEIGRIAAELGRSAPANEFITAAVHALERGERGFLGADDVLAGVGG
jgi:2-dehydropantoate 2-reductase